MKKALYFIEEMNTSKITPDAYTYSIILHGLKINHQNKALVEKSLEKIKQVIESDELRLDEVFFNSLLDVCCKYKFIQQMEEFH